MADPNLKLDVTVEMLRGGPDPENTEYRGVIRGTVASFRALISALSLKIKQGEGIQSDITIRGHGSQDVRIELIGEPDTNTSTEVPKPVEFEPTYCPSTARRSHYYDESGWCKCGDTWAAHNMRAREARQGQ